MEELGTPLPVVTLSDLQVKLPAKYCKLWESQSLAAVSQALKQHHEGISGQYCPPTNVPAQQQQVQRQPQQQQQQRQQVDSHEPLKTSLDTVPTPVHASDDNDVFAGSNVATPVHPPHAVAPAASPHHRETPSAPHPAAALMSLQQCLQLPMQDLPPGSVTGTVQASREAALHLQLLHDVAGTPGAAAAAAARQAYVHTGCTGSQGLGQLPGAVPQQVPPRMQQASAAAQAVTAAAAQVHSPTMQRLEASVRQQLAAIPAPEGPRGQASSATVRLFVASAAQAATAASSSAAHWCQ